MDDCICFARMAALSERGYVVQIDPPAGSAGRRSCPLGCGFSYRIWWTPAAVLAFGVRTPLGVR